MGEGDRGEKRLSVSVQLGWLPPQSQDWVPGWSSCAGQLMRCHDPTSTKGCYFPPPGDGSPWLCGWSSSAPSLSGTLAGCLAVLQQHWWTRFSVVLETALFPSAAQVAVKEAVWNGRHFLQSLPLCVPVTPLFLTTLVEHRDSVLFFIKTP